MTTITHPIGPNFPYELYSGGFFTNAIGYSGSGVTYDETILTSDQVTTLAALVAAHNPATPATPLPLDRFMPSGQTFIMGTDSASYAIYSGDVATISANVLPILSDAAALTAYLASSFNIQDYGGVMHALIVSQALAIYQAYWAYWQSLPGL